MDHHLQLCLLSNLGKRKTGFQRSVIVFLFKEEESTPVNKPARLERSDNKVPVSVAAYLGEARQGSFVLYSGVPYEGRLSLLHDVKDNTFFKTKCREKKIEMHK